MWLKRGDSWSWLSFWAAISTLELHQAAVTAALS